MKSEIKINQEKIIQSNLNVDFIDVVIIDFVIDFSAHASVKISNNGIDFYWFPYKKIIDELPLLRLKEDSIYRRMKRLCEIGLLIHFEGSKTIGRSFFSITKKGYGLKSDIIEIKEVSEEIQKVEEKSIKKPKIVRKKSIKKHIPKVEEVLVMKHEPKKQIKETKPVDRLYLEMVKIYFDWFENLSGGVKPKFGAIDGAAMKLIINYFKSLHKNANDGTDEFDEVTKMFRIIFQKWNLIDPFLQDQTKLTQINSNLQNIIIQIKNGHKRKSNSNDKSTNAIGARVQDSFNKLDEMLSKGRRN
jgi:hypothetical protein